MSGLVDTLTWLIDIPSVTGSEAALRDAIEQRLGGLPQLSVADSLVVGDPGPGSILLVGHLDTVPLQGEVGARVVGDRVFGLGATDMKGGLTVMIHLLETLGPGPLAGVFYAGEEGPFSQNQLGGILEQNLWLTEAEAAFVLEPTNRVIEAGCQGVVNARVGFEGEAAHSARPWLGENAITKAGGLLTSLGGLEPEPHLVDGIEFKEVVSVTGASGGVANNIIPSEFSLNVNYRFAPDRSPEEAVARLRSLCSEADRFELTDVAPPGLVSIDHPLFQSLVQVTSAPVMGKQGWTDVAQLSQAGIPAVNFGPGDPGLAHKPGESIRVDDLSWVYESLSEVLR